AETTGLLNRRREQSCPRVRISSSPQKEPSDFAWLFLHKGEAGFERHEFVIAQRFAQQRISSSPQKEPSDFAWLFCFVLQF
ncbi:MAG: hypothetical protein K2I89_02190, partial [Muribaculaceae bacterium]|nr:hypothetical protein [Muribaculaceae bacterium]